MIAPHRILVLRLQGKRPLGRPRYRWDDNIKMVLREIWWSDMDWIDLGQDKEQWRDFVITVMNLRVPWNVEKFLSIWATGGFSRRTQFHGVSLLVNDGCRMDNLRKRLRKLCKNLWELKVTKRKWKTDNRDEWPSVAKEVKFYRECRGRCKQFSTPFSRVDNKKSK
jgi:hypothetical protein